MKQTAIIDSPSAWKSAMQAQLDRHGMSRYAFVREAAHRRICTRHTAECLLADSDTVTGKREPSFSTALRMARLAGFDVHLVPTRAPRGAE